MFAAKNRVSARAGCGLCPAASLHCRIIQCRHSCFTSLCVHAYAPAAKWHGEQADKLSDTHFLHAHNDHKTLTGALASLLDILSVCTCAVLLTCCSSFLQAMTLLTPRP